MLASAWKQTRQETSKEKLRRGFGRPSKSVANPATLKFRAEVEELKLRTKCNRCGNVGHWTRECPKKRVQNYTGGGRGGSEERRFFFAVAATFLVKASHVIPPLTIGNVKNPSIYILSLKEKRNKKRTNRKKKKNSDKNIFLSKIWKNSTELVTTYRKFGYLNNDKLS